MSLIKPVELGTGVTVAYHKVGRVSPEIGEIEVLRFIDAATRKAGKSNVDGVTIRAPAETFNEDAQKIAGKSLKLLAYDYLKTLKEYADATDA